MGQLKRQLLKATDQEELTDGSPQQLPDVQTLSGGTLQVLHELQDTINSTTYGNSNNQQPYVDASGHFTSRIIMLLMRVGIYSHGIHREYSSQTNPEQHLSKHSKKKTTLRCICCTHGLEIKYLLTSK